MHPIIDFAAECGVSLYPGQAAALDEYYRSGKQNWLLLAGRRGGKSLISDLIALYEAIVQDFTDLLRPGEERHILIVSVRADNAALHIRSITQLLRHSKRLRGLIKTEMQDRLELTNGVTILSLPASARAGRGYGASTLILDEAAFFQDTAGNASADSVYTALEPTTATYGNRARIVITTSVGARVGLVYDIYSRADELEDWFVTKATSRELNPRISERTVSAALRKDAEAGAAEYLSEFRDPCEAFLASEAIDQAIDPSLREASQADGKKTYVMAIDPALMTDRYGFAIAHRFENTIILDYVRALKPPVDPNQAEELLLELNKKFHPYRIYCDTASTTERLRGKLPTLTYSPFTRPLKLKIYGSLKEALNLGHLVLYNHPELIEELKALQIRNGNDIAAPKAGRVKHDDLADCLALVVSDLVEAGSWSGVGWVPDPFEVVDADDNANIEPGYLKTIQDWEMEAGKPYNGRWHIHAQPHPEGVTWQNCPHRNQGCLACYQESKPLLDQDAEFWREYRESRPENPEPWRMQLERPHPVDVMAAEQAWKDDRLIKNFWKIVQSKKESSK